MIDIVFYKNNLLEYSWLYYIVFFQVYGKVNQLYIYALFF